MPAANDLDAMAAELEASGDYRVLRRLRPLTPGATPDDPRQLRSGLYLDVETTGLDFEREEIIQLAMLPFTYTLAGEIVAVGESFDRLRQPSRPISAEITRLTGITNEDVAGKAIAPEEVGDFAASADLVIAHNAAFDRPFVEAFAPALAEKPWACSMADVDWRAEGFEGTKLEYLAMEMGFFYDKHRALEDCMAGVSILSRPLPRSGETALARLLGNARRASLRVYATDAPFEAKDALRARRYRWSNGEDGRPRAWWIEIPEENYEAELEWLGKKVYRRAVELAPVRITAKERYSVRAR